MHLLNHVWPNIFETSPHVVNAVNGAIDGCRLALGPAIILGYTLQVISLSFSSTVTFSSCARGKKPASVSYLQAMKLAVLNTSSRPDYRYPCVRLTSSHALRRPLGCPEAFEQVIVCFALLCITNAQEMKYATTVRCMGPDGVVCAAQGLWHPARKVREVYWKIYNNLYIGAQDALVAFYPRLEEDGMNDYTRRELDIFL